MGANFGYYNGEELWPRNLTGRNMALKLHKNLFCLKWRSENVCFNQAVKELKDDSKIVHNYITEENV